MQRWLSHSSFFILSTCSEDGLDCSPRGDKRGDAFRIINNNTLAIPDRRGNNRIDTLRNLINDSRVGLLFIVAGAEVALRIKGTATISIAPDLLQGFVDAEQATPATVMLINVTAAYVQNARAIRSAELWNAATYEDLDSLPSAAELSGNPFSDAS